MDSLSYKTIFVSTQAVERDWLIVDAADKELGRLASRIAYVLRGKHKPGFTPHINCGDKVVVINAEKVLLSGNKTQNKIYLRHTGYPGGQRASTPADLLEKKPERIIEKAVKGMLPKNKLGRALFRNLYVYVGNSHPHSAQEPVFSELLTQF